MVSARQFVSSMSTHKIYWRKPGRSYCSMLQTVRKREECRYNNDETVGRYDAPTISTKIYIKDDLELFWKGYYRKALLRHAYRSTFNLEDKVLVLRELCRAMKGT
jgi:hypothetical protein